MLRHKVLGRTFANQEYFLTEILRGEGLKRFEERTQPGRVGQSQIRQLRIGITADAVVFQHLQYSDVPDLRGLMSTGIEMCIEYFWGDWWKNVGNEEDAIALDKSRSDRSLQWTGPFGYGVFLAGLLQDWDSAKRIASWVDDLVVNDVVSNPESYCGVANYLLVAEHLRGVRFIEHDKIVDLVQKSDSNASKLYHAMLMDAISGDQRGWSESLPAVIKLFLKKEAAPGPLSRNVSIFASLIALVGERNGLQWPKMPPKLDAAIVRRNTVGL